MAFVRAKKREGARMILLVTGGAGFIGSCFIRHILKKHSDYKVINLDALTYCGNLDNLKDIVIMAKKNRTMKNIFCNIIENLNIEDAVNELIKQGISVDDEYKMFMKKIIDINTDLFKDISKNITRLDIKESENIL